MTQRREFQLPRNFHTAWRDEEQAMEASLWLLEHMCKHLDLDHLGDTELLDFGCGVRTAQTLVRHRLPIKRYVGVDVSREAIDFLRENVQDSRFEYVYVNVHNQMYNPDGELLTDDLKLPFGRQTFDVICLFSVFTHLAPNDFRTLLNVLRRFVKPGGRLFFTLFLDQPTEHGRGLMDRWWAKLLTEVPPEQVTSAIEADRSAAGAGPISDFMDLAPRQPLKWAVYSEHYARSMIEETGWTALSLSPPDVNTYIQHHFVCAPTGVPG